MPTDTVWCKYPCLDTVWCNTDMINAEFVYYTNPAFIIFPGEKPYFSCNFNEKLLPHGQKIMRELFFCLNSSNILGTFWCKYAVQKSRLK